MAEYEVIGPRTEGVTAQLFGHIDPNDLCEQLKDIRDSLAPVVQDSTSGLPLQQVEVGLTLSASGKVAFIAEAGLEASITLTFGRQPP